MSEKRTTEETKKRRSGRTNYRPWIRLVIRLAIIAAVILCIFLIWKNWRKIAPEALLDWTDQVFGDAETGEGFPRKITGNTVRDMAEVNQHLVVLSDTTLRFFNADAACMVERTHSFSEPTMQTAGKFVMLTEQGGNRIRLDTRRETILEKTFEDRRVIYSGTLLSNGMTALVMNATSQSYTSEMVVLNVKGDILYTYKSNKYLLTDVALSSDGDKVAVIGTSANNGVLRSVLLVITMDTKEVKEYTGTDVLLHNVDFFENDTVFVLGDREVWTLTEGAEQPTKTSCDGVAPVGIDVSDTLAAVALRRDGTTNEGTIWVFASSGKRLYVQEYVGDLRSIKVQGDAVTVLTDTSLYALDKSGLEKTYPVPEDCLMALLYQNEPMILTLNELKRAENNG